MVHTQNTPAADGLRSRTGLSLTITAVSAAVSAAYSLQAVFTSDEVTARYAAGRSVALALAVGAVYAHPAWRTPHLVVGLGLTMGAVQVLDALVGVSEHDLLKTLGPAATGLVGVAAALAVRRAGSASE
jgi:hypothetical protein